MSSGAAGAMAWPEMIAHARDLERIREALHEAGAILRHFSRHRATVSAEAHDSPVTDADLAVDAALRTGLPRHGQGWLSEETPDDPSRLAAAGLRASLRTLVAAQSRR
jgi:fructose-1,6-bisphosphatase/inositol monophosphatase family enzyme